MARYNTAFTVNSISGATTLSTPNQGALTEFTGSGGFTVQLPNPALYPAATQAMYNASSGAVTLSTTANGGNIVGPGTGNTTTQIMPATSGILLYSDGTNWINFIDNGGPGAFSTLTASSTVTLSPSSANVAISPSSGSVTISPTGGLTIAPSSSSGTINNVAIGGTTPLAGAFTSLSANNGLTVTAGTTSVQALTSTGINSTPIGATTPSTGTFTALTATGTTTLVNVAEQATLVSSPGTSPSVAWTTSGIYYFTSLSGNMTLNITGVPTTAGRSYTINVILIQGATPYNITALNINGTAQTLVRPGGAALTSVASRSEIQSFQLLNVSGTATFDKCFTVLSSYA